MVGILSSMTAASARTSVPSVDKSGPAHSGAFSPAGKNVAVTGGDLPLVVPVRVVDVSGAVERLNELMGGRERSLKFDVDEASGRTVITVINPITKEVVRQIPPEELLAIAHTLERLGSLIDMSV
jgi:flagellar protein FlaG